VLRGANQEHGILSPTTHDSDERAPAEDLTARFPIGTMLRILPNHACATGAQFAEYHALSASGELAVWKRFQGW